VCVAMCCSVLYYVTVVAAVPRALDNLVFRADVEELAVIFCALTLGKKVAERHAFHIILM